MQTKKEAKKKILINLALVLIIFMGIAIIVKNNVKALDEYNLAVDALDAKHFLSEDYRKNGSTGYNMPGTINLRTAACIDPTHNGKSQSYQIQVILDIDNSYSTTLGEKSWSGVNYYVPKGALKGSKVGQYSLTNADLVKRGRFLAYLVHWLVNGSSNSDEDKDFFLLNISAFSKKAKNYNAVFKPFVGTDVRFQEETGWQSNGAMTYGWNSKYIDVYEEAKKYAEGVQGSAGGVQNDSSTNPTIEFTSTKTILGPYKLKFSGDGEVTGITVEDKNKKYTAKSGTVKVLNKNKKEIKLKDIPNKENFYIEINGIADEIKSITLDTTGEDLYAARIIFLAGGDNQRVGIYNSLKTEGTGSLTLKVPPAKPILVAYKYLKSVQRLQDDGTYKRLFTINETPKLTIQNAGKQTAKVTKVTYPDYKKYFSAEDLDENGNPYIYDGDLVEFQWVIYNIGPGATSPNATSKLVDEPGAGYILQSGKENGWTASGDTYQKTITLKKSLKGLKSGSSPAYYQGNDTMIYFKVDIQDKYENEKSDSYLYNNGKFPLHVVWKLSGKVFLDKLAQKDGKEDGILSNGDIMLSGIEVVLFDKNGKQLASTTTDNNGYYEFNKLDINVECYVRFKYNGQIYEPTTYRKNGASDEVQSYATDGTDNRKAFNNKFTPVDAQHTYPSRDDTTNAMFMIYAYTGSNGLQSLDKYNVEMSESRTRNVNFGIKEREQFDLNLRKELIKVDVQINGKTHTYDYNGAGEDLNIEIRGTDVPNYNRSIRNEDVIYKSDVQYDNDGDKLQVYVTYKIQIKNQSVGEITGYVLDLNDYADTSYELINSYDENNKQISWSSSGTVSGNGKTYQKLHTTALANEGITDKKWIFLQYKVSNDTLRDLLSEGQTYEDNFAEIAGYRNTYTKDRTDLNGKKISSAGENAGLLDIDSTPDNMNPTDADVQQLVADAKTQEYQNQDGETKTKRSTEVFEDDADAAPALKLVLSNESRKIKGIAFEDSPLKDRLEDNERVGDGTYQDSEFKVNQVFVKLICTNEEVNTLNPKEVRTNEDGTYEISGYIPGDYYLQFTYGDLTCIKAVQMNDQMYTGQDFKSTIYTEGNYSDKYWYQNTTPRNNDAKDNWNRREAVNEYSKTLRYSNATVLNATRDADAAVLEELANNTSMFADTAQMTLEVEYLGKEQSNYSVDNIDLGIVERPRTKIVLNKNVTYVKLTATDGSTIFDSRTTAPNLTWVENKYDENGNVTTGLVQGTVDENLLYGSTLTVEYTYYVRNYSETDYNEQSYYYTGKVADKNTINKMSSEKIIDYIPNALDYQKTNDVWKVLLNKQNSVTLDSSYRGEYLSPDVFDNITESLDEALETNVTSGQKLQPGETANVPDVIRCVRVIAGPEETSASDDMQNIAEIIELKIDNGRRPYYEDSTGQEEVEIPGNADPTTFENIEELDTGKSEILTLVVPFGANKQLTLIIITIVGLAILVTGVIVIKKKVL